MKSDWRSLRLLLLSCQTPLSSPLAEGIRRACTFAAKGTPDLACAALNRSKSPMPCWLSKVGTGVRAAPLLCLPTISHDRLCFLAMAFAGWQGQLDCSRGPLLSVRLLVSPRSERNSSRAQMRRPSLRHVGHDQAQETICAHRLPYSHWPQPPRRRARGLVRPLMSPRRTVS